MAVYVVSDKITPLAGELRLRAMTFDGNVLIEKKENVQVEPLSSKIYLHLPIEESLIARGIDPARVALATDLTVAGKVVSSNLIYLAPTVEIHLPPAPLKTELTKTELNQPELVQSGGGYRLRVSSPVLARSVYISFGEVDAEVSDNYFDLLPGQSVEIAIHTPASEDALRSGLKVISLFDAFDQNAAVKAAAGSK